MGKAILWLSFIGIGILLLVSLVAPDNPMVWLANTSASYNQLRFGMLAVLLALLVTNPPRNIYFRAFVGLLSLGVVSWTLSQTYQNHMELLDTLSILEVGISAGITVMEPDLESQRTDGKPVVNIPLS